MIQRPITRMRSPSAGLSNPGWNPVSSVRALGLELERRGVVQVSTNIEDPFAVPLAAVVGAVAARAPIAGAELVGLAPRAALEGFPADLPLRGRRVLEEALEEAFVEEH